MRLNGIRPGAVVAALLSSALLAAGCTGSGGAAVAPRPPIATTDATPSDTSTSRAPGVARTVSLAKARKPVSRHDAAAPGWHLWSRTGGGPVLESTVRGPRSGVRGKVWVWLPPQYHQAAYARTAFPVVLLDTGNTGVGENFWDNPRLVPIQRLDAKLSAQHRADPFIMVMPVLQLSVRQDTECSDIPGEPAMGTWEGVDLVHRIQTDFRTLPAPGGWAIAGASSGAFCAVKLALQHPRDYQAVVSWCGYFEPQPQTGRRWTPAEMAANSPTRMLERRHPSLRMLLLAGDLPAFRSDQARMRAFARLAVPPTQITTYLQHGGGHFIADLRKLLPMILAFLTANVQGPTSV